MRSSPKPHVLFEAIAPKPFVGDGKAVAHEFGVHVESVDFNIDKEAPEALRLRGVEFQGDGSIAQDARQCVAGAPGALLCEYRVAAGDHDRRFELGAFVGRRVVSEQVEFRYEMPVRELRRVNPEEAALLLLAIALDHDRVASPAEEGPRHGSSDRLAGM